MGRSPRIATARSGETESLEFHPAIQLQIVTRRQSEATRIKYFLESDVWKRAKKLKRLGFSGAFPDFAIPAFYEMAKVDSCWLWHSREDDHSIGWQYHFR